MTHARSPAFRELSVVAIVADSLAGELLRRTLSHSGDHLDLACELADGLNMISAHVPDAAFVDVTLGEGAGLAVLRNVRKLSPKTAVFAVTRADRLELGTQAVALGSAGTLVLPLSGDAVLTALLEVRQLRLANAMHSRPLFAGERMAAALTAEVAELGDATSRRSAAERLAHWLQARLGATRALVYLGAGEASRQLMRTAAAGALGDEPPFCDELELLKYAQANALEVVRLALRREQFGLVLVGGLGPCDETDALLSLVGSLATLVLLLVGAREQSSRGAMKDPESSAYTFAYFVDVAGREIAIARRHGRRFALATIAVQTAIENSDDVTREPTVQAAERVLEAVRDTDILARVDAHEFYLLLPETNGLGAQTCRRRVLEQLSGPHASAALEVSMGVAIFPHDGADLSRLLRVAKHRADESARSVVERFSLRALAFGELIDALLGVVSVDSNRARADADAIRYIELPAMDAIALALSALREAARAGQTRVVATQHAGISLGGAVRAEVTREMDGVELDVVEVGSLAELQNLDILVIIAENVCYLLLGRTEGGLMRAIHGTDPLLVDVVLSRLSEASGVRLFDA